MDSLKSVDLVNLDFLIEKLRHVPSFFGKCKAPSSLRIIRLNIKQLPENIGNLKHLTAIEIRGCRELKNLPESIGGLEYLCDLCLSGSGITQLPESLGKLMNLITLDVSNTKLRELPTTIYNLVHLQELDVSRNEDLRGDIPGEFNRLQSLKTLDFSKTGIRSLPAGIVNLSHLKTLSLEGCDMIQELPDLPESLTELKISSWLPRAVPNFSSLTNLVDLRLSRDHGYGVDP